MGHLPTITEESLTAGLQPIRGFVLAQALYHFMDLGIHEAIAANDIMTVAELAEELGLHSERLHGFLIYLANEGFIRLTEEQNVCLTATGQEIAAFRPWYKLLVGGYAQTFQHLSESLQANGPYAKRNSSNVGIGSCGISQYDALPMTRQLLRNISTRWGTIVDLGCGDGSYLIDLCKTMPGIRAVGIDPEPDSVAATLRSATHYGIADRISVFVGNATTLPDLSQEEGPFCFVTAFVLQEILEQSGRGSILDMLHSMFSSYPDSHLVVVEVDHRPTDASIMANGLGLAYYNPYYLIHAVTEQKLERIEFWEALFREAGLEIIAKEHPESDYDSLELKIGFLLSKAK